jgi:hypothetical protein
MADDARVSFIIAGVQKAGTTALFDYLSEDPGVSLSRVKEVHFFDDETRDWADPDYGGYHANFEPFDGRPRGEATPIYLYWPRSLERIAAYNPAMRLIFLLRDPVERAWSHWKMEYARGAETRPFAWCIREGRARLLDAEPWGHHREFSYVERGFYGEQLETALTHFPKESVLVLRSEDLDGAPAETLSKILIFLGIASRANPRPRRVHVGRDMDYGASLTQEDVAFLRGLYAADQARLAALMGAGITS